MVVCEFVGMMDDSHLTVGDGIKHLSDFIIGLHLACWRVKRVGGGQSVLLKGGGELP